MTSPPPPPRTRAGSKSYGVGPHEAHFLDPSTVCRPGQRRQSGPTHPKSGIRTGQMSVLVGRSRWVRGRIRMVRHLEKSFIIPFFTLVREKWSRGCLPRGPAGWVRQPVIEAHHHSTWQSSIPRVGPTIAAPPTWTTEGMRAGPKNKLQPSTY